MRILQVVTDTDRRGAQVFASDLHDALTRRSHDVETVALVAGTSPEGLELEVLGQRRLAPQVLRLLRERMKRFDITVAHGSTTGPACAFASLGLSTPFVYRQISDSRFWAPTRARRLRVRTTLRRARLVTALSACAAETLIRYIGIEPSRVRIVPNGVPVGAYRPATAAERSEARTALDLPDAFTTLFIGALVPEKGADLAIEATARLPGSNLVVVGEGPDRERLELAANRLAPGRVHFLGWLTDPLIAYHAADVFVLPSRGGDSMPATLIEAALCALPSISTRVGSIADVVLEDTTGVLVEAGDIEGLSSAFQLLSSDAALGQRMGAAGRTHSLANFDIDNVASAWEDVLRQAASA